MDWENAKNKEAEFEARNYMQMAERIAKAETLQQVKDNLVGYFTHMAEKKRDEFLKANG